ncbi:hypothetical protein [Halobellus rarus]|uniref:Uncharacterized protein n=1 Tax=Halobellus rarus TaxID=1126237 RepID=A0ABD6CLE9_9EURY|nr:hypothetical protein [Halobellus rarus]
MVGQGGTLKHAYDVGQILALFVVYVVALTFGTLVTSVGDGFRRLRTTDSHLIRRVTRAYTAFWKD